MDILCKVITNILHIAEILIICRTYLCLPKKTENKYGCHKIFMIITLASLINNAIEGYTTIALLIYLLCVEIVVIIYFLGNWIKLFICAFWVSVIVELIDLISLSIMNVLDALFNIHNILIEELFATILSVSVIYVVGLLLQKLSNKDGIKNISVK